MAFQVKTLQEICSLTIMKYGLSRNELPTPLVREVNHLEERIVASFLLTVSMKVGKNIFAPDSYLELDINWFNGKLAIGMSRMSPYNDTGEGPYELMVIKCGEENTLSTLGSKLFRLPGRQISVVDYNIDLAREEITLIGSCSSNTMPRRKALKIILHIDYGFNTTGLRIETKMYKDADSYDGEFKCRESYMFSDSHFFEPDSGDSDSEPESNLSFESGNFESDSNISDGVEGSESDSVGRVNLETDP